MLSRQGGRDELEFDDYAVFEHWRNRTDWLMGHIEYGAIIERQ